MSYNRVANSEKLHKLLRGVNWDSSKDRNDVYHELCKFRKWEGPLPDLGRILNRKEIEWLLTKFVYSRKKLKRNSLLDFAIKCKYKDVPELDEDGRPIWRRHTPLLHAAKCKRFDVAHKLFEIYDRPDVNYTDEIGLTHFHVACFLRKNELVKRFIEHGHMPDCGSSIKIYSPLLLAISHGNREIYRLLLKHGADPNRALDEKRHTALHVICLRGGDLSLMARRFLVANEKMNRQVLIDAKDKDGMTPLMIAISMKNWRLAELLLRRGADAKLADKTGFTPLHYACMVTLQEAQQRTAIGSLLHRIPNPKLSRYVDEWTIDDRLYQKLIELMLARGANPNQADARGWTVMHVICRKDEDDDDSLPTTLSRLCEALGKTLKIDEPDKLGYTPLHLAVLYECIDLVKLLLSIGANPNAVIDLGSNCLHLICQRDCDDLFLEVFLKFCDDRGLRVQLDAADKFGKTPLQWAVEKILPNVVGVLVGRGADVSRVVFPTMDHLDEIFKRERFEDRLMLAIDIGTIVLWLINKGYELSPENVRSIIKTFAKYGVRLAGTGNGNIRITAAWQ